MIRIFENSSHVRFEEIPGIMQAMLVSPLLKFAPGTGFMGGLFWHSNFNTLTGQSSFKGLL